MRYSLLLYYPEVTADDLGPDALAEGMRAFDEYARELDEAGVLASAEMLEPSARTTTVRLDDGALGVENGPRTDSKEQLGGVIVVEVDDVDAAIAWAARVPSARWGAVEVRRTATRYVDGAWTSADR